MASEPLTPVHVPKAAELVADALRGRILRRELLPDDRLPSESQLMEQYGVSRPTLREALRLLEAQQLLLIKRGSRGGGVVRVPGREPSIEAITLWLLLSQPGVTRQSAEHLAAAAHEALDLAAASVRPARRRRAA
jgi:GntR family transcriptional repressor for pyruvate dehydrogenase complex